MGTGLVSGGVLLEGHRGCAAEGGHLIFREDGVPYAAGATGCYEAYLGGEALAQRARDAGVAEDTEGLVAAWTDGDERAAPIMTDACAAMAAKRTGDLIPLCHPIGLDAVTIDFTFSAESTVEIEATVRRIYEERLLES